MTPPDRDPTAEAAPPDAVAEKYGVNPGHVHAFRDCPDWNEHYRSAPTLDEAWRRAEAAALPRDAVLRFVASVDSSRGPAGCWPWRGSVTGGKRGGYGHLSIDGRDEYAHRFSYQLFVGPLEKGAMVLHHCDHKDCVNPAHLYAGDHADNTRDAVERGRMASGERNSMRLHPERRAKGERQGAAKLTGADVIRIRQEVAEGKSTERIAEELGVHRTTVLSAATGRSWTHISLTAEKLEAHRG